MLEIVSKNAELARVAQRVLCGTASQAELCSLKREDAIAIRTDPGERHYRSVFAEVEKVAVDEKANATSSRTRRYVASDETPDRYGDVILVKGWDFDNFKQNPVALWAHDDYSPPIGTVGDITKGTVAGRKVLKESITYFGQEVNALSETVLRLVDAGGLRAVSVGFIPKKWKRASELPQEQRESYGVGAYGILFEEVEQIELSNCTIPANPNALVSKTLVPMVRDMEASGQIPASMARDFYRAVEQLEGSGTGRRVFALGEPSARAGGEAGAVHGGPPEAEAPAAPPSTEQPSDEELRAQADAEERAGSAAPDTAGEGITLSVSASSAPPADLALRLAALEAAHAQLRAAHDETRELLARSVKNTEQLLGLIEQLGAADDDEPSGSDGQPSGREPTKSAETAGKKSSYLDLVLGFREELNRT